MEEVILFWGPDNPYPEFSNFHPSPFILDGLKWETVEHYFQAQKATSNHQREMIRLARTPDIAKRFGRECELRKDWNEVKVDVMFNACIAKYQQNPDLLKILLDTGNAVLHEDSPYDFIWGWRSRQGDQGLDLLGKVLMRVRKELRDGG